MVHRIGPSDAVASPKSIVWISAGNCLCARRPQHLTRLAIITSLILQTAEIVPRVTLIFFGARVASCCSNWLSGLW
jgi:hypothetical protein